MHSGLRIKIFFLLIPAILTAGIPVSHLHHFIESPKLSQWGEWGKLEHCPSDQVVIGMRLKVQETQAGIKDDTGLNAVKFYCQNPYSTAEYTSDIISITSLIGTAGSWKKEFFCPITPDGKHVAVGFQLRSESSSGVKDDTAGNNLKLICSDLYQKSGFTYLTGDGTSKGEWTKEQKCKPGYAICGIQTQVEMSKSMDTTGLNNLKVRCCKADGAVNSVNSTRTANETATIEHADDKENSLSEKETNSSAFHHRVIDVYEGIHNTPEEQELVAIDPNADFIPNDPLFPVNFPVDHPYVSPSGEERQLTTDNSNTEDETLPQEIAGIDQVDNSESRDYTEKSEKPGNSQDIEDVANVLEDVDNPTSQMEETDQGSEDEESSKNFSDEDFSLFTSYKESNERTNFHMQDSDESSEFGEQENALQDHADSISPKSSPHYGQAASVSNTTGSVTPVSSAPGSRVSNLQTLGLGYLVMLMFAKLM